MRKVCLFDECSAIDSLDYIIVVYYYERVSQYEAVGQALAWDGTDYWLYDLGHCSCYGPLEHNPTKYTIEEIVKMVWGHDLNVGCEIREEICYWLKIFVKKDLYDD
jgi:hypothetical protein